MKKLNNPFFIILLILLFLGFQSFKISAQKNFLNSEALPSEKAFKIDFVFTSPSEAVIRWKIKDYYYLYKKKFAFKSEDFFIDDIKLPTAKILEDPLFGKSEVYYNLVEATLLLRFKNPKKNWGTLDVTYQGCWEGGVCYPEENISIKLLGL